MLAVAMCLPMVTHADDELSTKILLIPTALDHPYATHMYPQVCELLAACLNQTTGGGGFGVAGP